MKSLTTTGRKSARVSHLPRVSVLTPIYNTNPTHLREMIDSILSQTFTDFEFLILNDSPDNTEIEKIVQDYAKKDKRVKYSKNDKNMGITPSRNKLLKMARGEYLAIFDHDDISVPDRLAREVEILDTHANVGVVSGWMQNFGDVTTVRHAPEFDMDIKIAMTENSAVWHTAAMIRKSVLTDNNIEYEESYSPCEDYRLWARLMDKTAFHNIQDILVKYRMFGTQTSVKHAQRMHYLHHAIRLDIINRFPAYRDAAVKAGITGTRFRLRLFGIPLLKIKHNTVYLFEFIPLFKIKWS